MGEITLVVKVSLVDRRALKATSAAPATATTATTATTTAPKPPSTSRAPAAVSVAVIVTTVGRGWEEVSRGWLRWRGSVRLTTAERWDVALHAGRDTRSARLYYPRSWSRDERGKKFPKMVGVVNFWSYSFK